MIGFLAGILAVGFRRALGAAEHGREVLLHRLHDYPSWGWIILPIIGLIAGGLAGWMTTRFAPEASGSGIPHLKGALLHVRTLNWRALLPVKFLGGVLGIGAGLSLGREGPTVQMGAAVARALMKPLRVSAADTAQLFSAGAGAGLAAAFNAPLAGLIFVVEELHRELSSRTAGGALVAAVCATVVTQAFAGDTPAIEARDLMPLSLSALPLVGMIGILAGGAGVFFNRYLLTCLRGADYVKSVPRWIRPGVACFVAGLVAWWVPGAVGGGHLVAERLLGGTLDVSLAGLVVLLVVKFLLTGFSYGSGAPGGIFAPMLLLGALLGVVVARVAGQSVSGSVVSEPSLAVLGMAAFFVGSVRAPLTGIVLISELTGGYALLFPTCIACLAAYLIGEALRDRPIYEALLERDLERAGHGHAQVEPRSMYLSIQIAAPIANRRIADAGLPRGCLITAVNRAGTTLLPSADMVLRPGDHVSILAPGDQPEAPMEIVRLCTGL